MKKFISLVACVAIVLSLFTTVSFAATTNFSVDVSALEVSEGDTFTVTLKLADLTASTVSGGFYINETNGAEVTCTAIADARGRNVGYLKDQEWGDWINLTAFPTVDDVNSKGTCGVSYLGTSDVGYAALDVVKATFTAVKAGTVTFSIFESTDGQDAANADGVNPVALTIKGSAPAAPVVGTPSNDGDNAKVWAVTVAGDYVATKNGALDATLTQKDLSETQEFKLNVNGIGEAEWTFNVRVTFQNPDYRANTDLTVE